MRAHSLLLIVGYSALALAGCTDSADGFASLNGGTTGGAGGTTVTVSTYADLKKYATATGKYVIKVSGKITMGTKGEEILVTNDKTIIGIGTTGEIFQGGFQLKAVKNVIIRNLKIGNTYTDGTTDNDWDGIQSDTSTNIWIDHCIFENGEDGLVDLRKDSNYYTVSNNIFRNHDKTLGIGWTDNVISQGTIHHNYFLSTNQRNPSADNMKYCHLYNNYVKGITSYGHYARGATNARVENCYFESTKNPLTSDSTATLTATGNTYKSCTGTIAVNKGTAFTPASFYKYTLDATANVPTIVLANAGPKASVCS